MFSPCLSALSFAASGRDAAIKRGEVPSSRCKLIPAGAKYAISVEVTVEEGQYSSTNRKLSIVGLVAKSAEGQWVLGDNRYLTSAACPITGESLGGKCSDDVLDRLVLTNQA